jgi:hypothetical protein
MSAPPGGDGASPSPDASIAPDGSASTGSPLDAITRMCMMNNACGYQSRYFREADRCVSNAVRVMLLSEQHSPEHRIHFARMVECARTATTCAQYVRCADFGIALSGMVMARCNGTVLDQSSTPGGQGPRTFDCAAWSGGTCSGSQCVYPLTTPCTNINQSRCDGTTRVWCRATSTPGMGTEIREPCPSGMECMGATTYSASDVACTPALRSCAAAGVRCDGDAVVMCAMDPRPGMTGFIEQRTDCARAGLRCGMDERGRPACLPTAMECMAAANPASAVKTAGERAARRGVKLVCLQHRADDRGPGNGRSGQRQRSRGRRTAVGWSILPSRSRAPRAETSTP